MATRILFSTKDTPLGEFQKSGDVFRKDFIREGTWVIKKKGEQGTVLPIDKSRIRQWGETFKLFRDRGISVPLTVDHIEVTDPKGKTLLRKLTPAMAEAKRGDVVNLFEQDGIGFCEVSPADKEAETLMSRCPEVSLELERDYIDAYGNYYPEAITAITLTPKPVIPGQMLEWEKIAASREGEDDRRSITYLSAEPLVMSRSSSEKSMHADLLGRLRSALKMPNDPEDHVYHAAVNHMEMCRGRTYMSREDVDKEVAIKVKEAQDAKDKELADKLKESTDKVTLLSRQLDEAKAGTRIVTVEELAKSVDEDALDMAATGIEARINALGAKATPNQKKLLMSKLVGEQGKRNVISLSKKTAERVGLPATLSNIVLEIFEAGDVGEMQKMLAEQTGTQKVVLTKDPATEPENPNAEKDEDVTNRMIKNCNRQFDKQAGFSM